MDDFFKLYGSVAKLQIMLTSVLGALCLATPGLVFKLFGAEVNPAADAMMRAFGASVIYVATVTFLTRKTRDKQTALAVSWANVIEDGLLTALTTQAVLAGTFSAMGWLLVGIFGFEVLLNGYVIASAPKTSSQNGPGTRSDT